MIEIGRLCLKIAGRDAGKKCVIVDVLDSTFVLIDGETRRRKCNILHVEPLKNKVELKKNASHEDVKKVFEGLGLKTRETKPKQKTEKPVKKKKVSEKKKDVKKKTGKKKETKVESTLEDKAASAKKEDKTASKKTSEQVKK
ncbi:50S ribosomal protein L14e [Candidatus Woesearchaeota archaeon]|nr:50S ribosomal protein L14e [Candidatus Woesearchaeota archaeon]